MPRSMLRELWHSSGTRLSPPVVKGRGRRRKGKMGTGREKRKGGREGGRKEEGGREGGREGGEKGRVSLGK